MSEEGFRRILGNLDSEHDLATLLGEAAHRPTRAALESASVLATLLRAFAAGNGDRLWTPTAVAPERLADVPGLPRPALESGPLETLPAARAVLAWAWTPGAAAQRAAPAGTAGTGNLRESRTGSAGVPPASSLHQLAWRLPAAEPAVVAAVHHRAFALETARRLGHALPGARLLASPEGLAEHLRTLGGDVFGPRGVARERAWIVKAPLSAAGRSRHLVRGRPTERDRRRVARLFARHGRLLFEPWLERVDDYGLAAIASPDGTVEVGFHRSSVGPRGAFQGLELDALFAGLRGLDEGDRRLLRATLDGVGRALAARGYAGPFGIDCWRYRRPSGELSWNPLGEINARMTLGLVARALVDRVREPLGIDPRATVRLRWGDASPPGSKAVELVRAGGQARRALAVWLTVHPPGTASDRQDPR